MKQSEQVRPQRAERQVSRRCAGVAGDDGSCSVRKGAASWHDGSGDGEGP